MKIKGFWRSALILTMLMVNIGCDQLSKSIVRKDMNDDTRIGFLSNHITIAKIENSGAFLSMGDSLAGPLKLLLLDILPLLALGFGLFYILTKTNLTKLTLAGIILILGGGLGNLYDRLVHGSVTDFMHINFVIFQTGVFNVADMSIMAGMFMILIQAWLKPKPVENATNV